ncbi:hypothetical protein HDV01_003657 [Terramyces sp. JEL0728]|nr:hypothetical protein HDV01_003657 [Terramyces sp. JEL0728]
MPKQSLVPADPPSVFNQTTELVPTMDLQVRVLSAILILQLAFILVVSVFGLYSVKSNPVQSQFRIPLIFMLSTNIVLVVLTALNFGILESVVVGRIGIILGDLVAVGILWVNTQFLQIFSALNENITKKKVTVFRIIMFTLVFIADVCDIISLVMVGNVPSGISKINGVGSLFMVLLIITYDNVQSAYLTALILYTKNRDPENMNAKKKKLDSAVRKAFTKMMLTNIAVLVFDWIAVAYYLYLYLTAFAPNNYPLSAVIGIQICELNAGIHACIMLFVIRALKDFTVTNVSNSGVSLNKTKEAKSLGDIY